MIKLVSGRGYLFEAEVSTEPRQAGRRRPRDDRPAPNAAERRTRRAALAKASRPFRLARARGARRRGGLGAIVGLAVAAPIFGPACFKRTPPTIAVMPIAGAGNDSQVAAMAAGVTDRLTDGLAKIDNIRVVAPPNGAPRAAPARASGLRGDRRIAERRAGVDLAGAHDQDRHREVQPVASISVDINDADLQLQQSRLAAGSVIRWRFASTRCSIRRAVRGTDVGSSQGSAKVVIEQATASINQTTRERFAAAQTMLEKALADDPDNVDLGVALAALQLRGIQMVWYSPADARAAEANARRCWSARCGQSPITFRCSKLIAASSTRPTISSKAWWPARGR